MIVVNDEPIVVVCAADDNYAMPLAVTMRSALEHLATNRKIVFFIIDGGIKEQNKQKILKSVKSEQCYVKWLAKPDERRLGADVWISGHITIASYYRLFLVELLPDQYKKIIYLDCDLVVKKDLGQLWDMEMGESYLLGVPDYKIPYLSSPDCKYFNAGVLVINLQKWRANNITDKVNKYLQKNKGYITFHDQDVLNTLFAGNWGELDPRWNHQSIDTIDQGLMWKEDKFPEDIYKYQHYKSYIIHYTSPKKPWNTLEKCPRNDEFFHYVDKTAWSGWRFTVWYWNWTRLVGRIKRLRSKFYLKLQGIGSTMT